MNVNSRLPKIISYFLFTSQFWLFLYDFFVVFLDLVQNYGTIVKLEYFGNYPIINLFDAEDIYYAVKHAVAFRPAAEILKLYRNSRKDRYGILGIAHTYNNKIDNK